MRKLRYSKNVRHPIDGLTLAARLLAYTGLICSVGAQAAVYLYRDAIADPETVELFALATGAPAIVAAFIDACANKDVPDSYC